MLRLKKFAIIVGHTSVSRGAVNYLGETEYDFNLRIAHKVQELINLRHKDDINLRIFHRLERTFSSLKQPIKKFQPDFTLELHFNSFALKSTGCEMLIYKDSKYAKTNIKIADKFTDMFSSRYGIKERQIYKLDDQSTADGVLVLSEGRGCENLKTIHECGVRYVMLFEPVFANFETKDSKLIFEDEERYAEFLAEALVKVVLPNI